jgi:hypothetical protein
VIQHPCQSETSLIVVKISCKKILTNQNGRRYESGDSESDASEPSAAVYVHVHGISQDAPARDPAPERSPGRHREPLRAWSVRHGRGKVTGGRIRGLWRGGDGGQGREQPAAPQFTEPECLARTSG